MSGLSLQALQKQTRKNKMYSTGDLIWIPDKTKGVIDASRASMWELIDGPIYGLVVSMDTFSHNGDRHQWLKTSLKYKGEQRVFYVQKKDVQKHTEI